MTDELLFSGSDDLEEVTQASESDDDWKILIIDDEPEVHQITKLALANVQFENRNLQYLDAYSAEEAYSIIKANPDIALALLDVVMESNHAGLDLIQRIRKDLNNHCLRIILRTGQPGLAPERDIIVNYDINDYVEKADLSAQKLFTVIVAGLRGYRDILKLEESRKELLQANEELAEQSERIQVTLDSIGDGVLTTDAEGKITHLNPVAQSLTGWQLEDALGRDVKEVFPIVDASTAQTIENPIDKVIATGEVVYLSNHTTLISKSGQHYQIADSAAPIRNVEQDILGMVLVFNDVTEQYALREEMKKSRRNLQTIMDFTPAVIYAKDIEGRYVFVNQKFETLFNIKNADIIGKTDFDIFPTAIAEKFQENDKAAFAAGKGIEFEEDAPIGEKTHHYLSVKFPLYDDKNRIYAVCGISTDITERKIQEEQIRRSQKMEAIGQLTGGIAHDFNNQLGVSLGYLDFLSDFAVDDKEASSWIDISRKAVLRCTDLTRQLLSFSRMQSDDKLVVDINASLEELKTIFSRSITPAIGLEYFLEEDLWLVDINPSEFQDAALNLVINARDAMPNGGSLLIESCNKSFSKEDVVSLGAESGDYVQISFSDSGVGMSQMTQEKVFEPFYTTKPKGQGTGLGMSMVYGFVKRFGGFIKIYSELDVGTTIRLYFPKAESSKLTEINTSENVEAIPTGRETILVVDDEPALLNLADQFLQSFGYKTYAAENAQQALMLFDDNPDITCLFSDVVMPGGMNGYELAEILTEKNPQLKVLLSSGFTSKVIEEHGSRFSETLLTKPYRKAELAQRIRLVLDKKD